VKTKNPVQIAIDTTYFSENEKHLVQLKITSKLNSSSEQKDKKRKFLFTKILSFSVLTAMAIGIFLFAGLQSGLINNQSGSTKKHDNLTAKPSYQFEIIDSSVKSVFLENANVDWDDQNTLEYSLTFKNIGKEKYEWSSNEMISIDIFAKKKLKSLMVDNLSSPDFTLTNSNIRSLNGTLKPPTKKNDEIWTYQMQYEIKKGIDPEMALKYARNATFIIQIGGNLVQKTDLLTMETISLNTPTLTRDQRYERSKLREGIDLNRSRDFLTLFLGKQHKEMASTKENETIWRYDIDAVNGYTFKESPYKPDVKGLQREKLKKQIYVTINEERNVKNVTVYYLNDKDHKVHRYSSSAKGEKDVALTNKAKRQKEDLGEKSPHNLIIVGVIIFILFTLLIFIVKKKLTRRKIS
jgi:hypothetical protein